MSARYINEPKRYSATVLQFEITLFTWKLWNSY